MLDNHIFALDIGTRSVTGIILKKENNAYSLVDYYMKEHKERSMLDGQIHHVVEVANIIKDVKEALEDKHGPLTKVSVAAAGRSLKTMESVASIPLDKKPITDHETIKHLELSAVHAAQLKLASQNSTSDYASYYCVGYSVLHYKIDDQQIGSLIEQSGDTASVELIATFLPKIVVESLLSALNRANLEMNALTLEPIAAIYVLIPESMRRLNVALVDIGAGTSDIAITNHGTVAAYGMVPVAGDEITEAISDKYLLDYPIAEKTKRKIVNEGKAVVSDILGFETTITYKNLASDIQESIDKLASRITEEVLSLNGSAPKAVMLVGGGSLTPELPQTLARKLQLPENRVAVRSIDAIQSLIESDNLPTGPDFVTPIGIAIVAEQNPIHYITVQVNGQIIRMFKMKQLTVGDCLVQSGIEIKKLYGKPGMASIVSLNGKEITLPGDLGTAPSIVLNGSTASVDSFIKNGDQIHIEPGSDGMPAHITLEDLIEELPSIKIFFNSNPYELETKLYVNGQLHSTNYVVQDRDTIVLQQPKTIQDFLSEVDPDSLPSTKDFLVYVNNKSHKLGDGDTQILVNGEPAALDYRLKHRDQLTVHTSKQFSIKDILMQKELEYSKKISVTFNEHQVTMEQPKLSITKGDWTLDEDSLLNSNDRIQIKDRKLESFIFQDIFRYVDIDIKKMSGSFKLYKNGQESSFYDTVDNGDHLELK